jgi:hypothetical protein
MNEMIEKYEAKLDYLNKAVEQTKHLMDEDTLDMMNDMKILLTEVVTDFKTIHETYGGDMSKQETLEEAAKRLYQKGLKDDLSLSFHDGIKFGAKWQEERMYSEEDIREAYFSAIKITGEGWNGEYAGGNNPNIEENFMEDFNKWFEQFKKQGGYK